MDEVVVDIYPLPIIQMLHSLGHFQAKLSVNAKCNENSLGAYFTTYAGRKKLKAHARNICLYGRNFLRNHVCNNCTRFAQYYGLHRVLP
jgi:hypothetical protein